MEIRELKSEELEKLLVLYEQLHENDDEATGDRLASTWDHICSSSFINCLGVFEREKLISSCILVVVPNLTRGCRPFGVIENVVTDIDYRNKGYGKDILKSALDLAWSLSCYKVMLLTGRLNEKTFKFYESVGFNRHSKKGFVAKPSNT